MTVARDLRNGIRMKKFAGRGFLGLSMVFAFGGCATPNHGVPVRAKKSPARKLVEEMVQTVGGLDRFRKHQNVEYTYIYRDPSGKEDVSLERYVFAHERSWARYTKHEVHVFPDNPGEVIQAFDGTQSWVTVGGQLLDDAKALKLTDFLRKTNFYWFTMMFKLLDEGVILRLEGVKEVEGVAYNVVRVEFPPGMGDVQDTYLLYLHPETKLVDQFLFTVMDFGMKEPLLMKVEYTDVEGLLLPATRRYTKSNWDGEFAPDSPWTIELMHDIRFDVDLDPAIFHKPTPAKP